MVSASWALWQITWAHRYSVFPGRVSRWKKYPANARWQQIANKMPCVFFIFSILVITYVTWTWHEQDGFEIDMTTHKGRETTLLTEQMLECFWIFFVHPWNLRVAKSVVNKCILKGKSHPTRSFPPLMRHRFTVSLFRTFCQGTYAASPWAGCGFHTGRQSVSEKKTGWWRKVGERWCVFFGGVWVGQNWMGIGQKYPEITLSTLDFFLKRDVHIYIYIYIHINVSFNIYNIDRW